MSFLEETFLGNTVEKWLIAACAGLAVIVALVLLKPPLLKRLKRFSQGTDTMLDDLLSSLVEETKTWFMLAIGVLVGSKLLRIPPGTAGIIDAVVVVLALVQAGVWGNQGIAYGLGRYMKRRIADDAAAVTTLAAVTLLTKIILWSVVLLLALDNVGVDVTALVAGLGVGGIAVALAAQSVLADLFASMAIVFDKPFVLGDFIIVGDMMGTVENIGLKTTRVRSLSGEQLVFSNTSLLSSQIRNFKRMQERRVVFSLGVTYQTTAEQLERIPKMIREVVEAQEKTRFDRSHFKAYGAYSLDFETVYYMLEPDYNVYMDAQQAINLELFKRFQAAEIEFAYPTQTVLVTNEENGDPAPASRPGGYGR